MLKVRNMSSTGTRPACCSQVKIGGTVHDAASTTAAVPCGRILGRFSVMPPPVMCAIPLIRPPASRGLIIDRYERCGSSNADATVVPNSGTWLSTVNPRPSKMMRRASE